MYESKLLAELEQRFPWLTVDAESEDYDEPSGADVIADLVEWHKDARRDAFLCAACGRPETDCSANPCAAVQRDREAGAVSLPLTAAQAAIALGLASGVASLMAWAQGLIGGVL
jgi:hypothetical protein